MSFPFECITFDSWWSFQPNKVPWGDPGTIVWKIPYLRYFKNHEDHCNSWDIYTISTSIHEIFSKIINLQSFHPPWLWLKMMLSLKSPNNCWPLLCFHPGFQPRQAAAHGELRSQIAPKSGEVQPPPRVEAAESCDAQAWSTQNPQVSCNGLTNNTEKSGSIYVCIL